MGYFLAVCVVFFLKETGEPVNHAYACGAERWVQGRDLYGGEGGFIYPPQSAVVYIPFYLMGGGAEQVFWRLTTVSLFATGVFQLSRLAGRGNAIEFFPLVTLLVLPKTWTCAYSGQATLAMAGLSMWAVAEVERRKWGKAAGLLVAALAFKPLAFVLLLLLAVLHAPLRSRLALGLCLYFLAPYLVANGAYVNRQYLVTLPMLNDAAKVGLLPEWAQLFSLCHLVGQPVPETWQTVARIVAAAAVCALCWRISVPACGDNEPSRSSNGEPAWLNVLAIATAYLLLFNPRTENNSYVLLAPVLAIQCVWSWRVDRRLARAACRFAAAVAIVAGHELCVWLTPHAGFIWICPLVCLLLTIHDAWTMRPQGEQAAVEPDRDSVLVPATPALAILPAELALDDLP